MAHFSASQSHLLAELEIVDFLVRAQVGRARQLAREEEGFQGLVISEAEVDQWLAQAPGLPAWGTAGTSPQMETIHAALKARTAEIEAQTRESEQRGIALRLPRLLRLFGLSDFEKLALLICLAPEIDLRYERLYAYLQDDVTRKHPSIDLILNLLCRSLPEKLSARQWFSPGGNLFTWQLLRRPEGEAYGSAPGNVVKIDGRIAAYLLDSDEVDGQLRGYAEVVTPQSTMDDLLLPAPVQTRLRSLQADKQALDRGLILYFQGGYGVGKQSTAAALCNHFGQQLLVVAGSRIADDEPDDFAGLVQRILREARLQEAALYWPGFDTLSGEGAFTRHRQVLQALAEWRGLAILAGRAPWEAADMGMDPPIVRIEFPLPSYHERRQLWQQALDGVPVSAGEAALEAVAARFRLSGGQIRDAAASAANLARWRPQGEAITLDDLYAACRLQSNRGLADLAHKITPHYTWEDIVLPPEQMQHLREVCNYVKYHPLVFEQWGFASKLSLGKGLNVLFAGPSGTGKTMAAEIIAHELGLDLYRIDLSTVVSKYIGETEKNLARIFDEAETSNAILFFDEADALFGKRSEVRDAHDRYANIEVSYLLQRMEAYEGIAILASNLSKNMDDAFVRRMHYTIDFPFPDAAHRRRIWAGIWPAQTPRQPSLDLDFMAERFEITGGSIRNIALAAAFLAAADGQLVDMRHLMLALRREYIKMGKVVHEGDFGRYAQHVRQTGP